MTTHLDLGCGTTPRNPYKREKVFGIDIRPNLGPNIKCANLSIEKIPYETNSFDSVSAYDFLEHIPRVAIDVAGKTSFFPFINLMNEINRVLKPSGLFYSVTPVYPSHKSFVDPTHVNFISKKTHGYFIGPNPLARMYGFTGTFDLVRAVRIRPKFEYEPHHDLARRILIRPLEALRLKHSHIVWEFKKSNRNED